MVTKSTVRARPGTRYPVVDPASLPALEPLPDGLYQSTHFLDAVSMLKAHFGSAPDVLVEGNTIVCYNPNNLNDRVLPDCYVAFGVDPDPIYAQNGYLIWEVGKPPDFVLEIGSVSTARRDMTFKRDLYARIGVREYWRFDPSGGEFYGRPLAGERLVDGIYAPIALSENDDGMQCGYSPVLGLSLCVGDDRLLLHDPMTGEYLRTLSEALAETREAEAGLSQERIGRLEAEARAREAETRARELEEELRRLRS